MDPRTGEILAMASRPTFDPNDFAVRISRNEWNKLVNDEDHPLLNKAIQAQLAPGSTFKIIMATAGMQEGIAQDMKVTAMAAQIFTDDILNVGLWRNIVCMALRTSSKAIYQSCDVFFYTLAEKLGIEKIAKYATAFGLGQKTGIDLPQEATGIMPSEEWKLRNYQAEVVCRRNDFRWHRAGCRSGHTDSDDACHWCDCQRWTAGSSALTYPTDLPPGVIPASNVPDETKSLSIRRIGKSSPMPWLMW